MTNTNLTWNPFTFTNDYVTSIEEARASQKPVKYIMSNDGKVYEMRSTALGDFIAEATEVKGIEKVEVGFKLNIPKIPFKLLLQAVSFFRDVCDEFANDEAMLQYWYDTETGEFFAKCLEQTTNKVHVTFVRDEELETNPRYILVMDIHSHNNMDAFFSGTDDASEQQTRTYGVVGRLDQEIPKILFRYSVEGKFVMVPINELFEMPTVKFSCEGIEKDIAVSPADLFYPQVEYPQEWLKVIEEGKKNAARFRGIGNAPRHGSYQSVAQSKTGNTALGRKWDSGALNLSDMAEDPFTAVDQLSLFQKEELPFSTFGSKSPSINTAYQQQALSTREGFGQESYVLNSDDGPAEDLSELAEVAGFFASQLEVVEDSEARVESLASIVDTLSMFEIKMLVDRMLELGHENEIVDQLKDNGFRVSHK